jgi:hypothetical protein
MIDRHILQRTSSSALRRPRGHRLPIKVAHDALDVRHREVEHRVRRVLAALRQHPRTRDRETDARAGCARPRARPHAQCPWSSSAHPGTPPSVARRARARTAPTPPPAARAASRPGRPRAARRRGRTGSTGCGTRPRACVGVSRAAKQSRAYAYLDGLSRSPPAAPWHASSTNSCSAPRSSSSGAGAPPSPSAPSRPNAPPTHHA